MSAAICFGALDAKVFAEQSRDSRDAKAATLPVVNSDLLAQAKPKSPKTEDDEFSSAPKPKKDAPKGPALVPGTPEFKAQERRLAVVETLMLGPKQRLIIVRRDNVEHLVVVTADSACVVENNIPASSKFFEAPTP